MYEFPICKLMAQIGRYQSGNFHQGWGHRTDYHSLLWQSDIKLVWAYRQIEFDLKFWIDQRQECSIPSLSEICLTSVGPDSRKQLTIEWVGADEEKSHSFVTIIWKHQFGAELPFCDDLHWSDSSLQSCQYRPQYSCSTRNYTVHNYWLG